MQLKPEQKRLIVQVINVFENGTPYGDFGAISVFKDGPHRIKQITYGRARATEYGNLRHLVERYMDAGGAYGRPMEEYADRIGSVPLTFDRRFRVLLRRAGRQDPVMAQLQTAMFDRQYFDPAMDWAEDAGLRLPLSLLVVLDSFLQSGSVLALIRSSFDAATPAEGGDERLWTAAYVTARHRWLTRHRLASVRESAHRTVCLAEQIRKENWNLGRPVASKGLVVW